jgi:hypothetical protein
VGLKGAVPIMYIDCCVFSVAKHPLELPPALKIFLLRSEPSLLKISKIPEKYTQWEEK